ncbi:MAG: HAD family hydrolase [bacterium]
MSRFDKILVLDLDETLIHASRRPLARDPDFCVFDYFIYKRPHVDVFLRTCLSWFQVGVWSSSGTRYAAAVAENLFEHPSELAFCWAQDRCITRFHWQTGENSYLKPIKKLQRKGYAKEKILYVDDSPEKLIRSYGNAIYVRTFDGIDEGDNELELLLRYLKFLGPVDDVRRLEKRNWRGSREVTGRDPLP